MPEGRTLRQGSRSIERVRELFGVEPTIPPIAETVEPKPCRWGKIKCGKPRGGWGKEPNEIRGKVHWLKKLRPFFRALAIEPEKQGFKRGDSDLKKHSRNQNHS